MKKFRAGTVVYFRHHTIVRQGVVKAYSKALGYMIQVGEIFSIDYVDPYDVFENKRQAMEFTAAWLTSCAERLEQTYKPLPDKILKKHS
jgi:hypothetical protein